MDKRVYKKGKVNEERKSRGYELLKEEISPSNVLEMAELIALAEMRYLIGTIGANMQRDSTMLFIDIKCKYDVDHILSDGYDWVQEGALYLCEHYGQHLSDVIGYSKKGKKITVEMACIRKMTKLIGRKSRDRYRNISLEALTRKSEPTVEMKEEIEQDYAHCDEIIENLNLTDNMRVALECRMSGLSYPEIGRILARTQSTVYEYFIKMRMRYTAIYG